MFIVPGKKSKLAKKKFVINISEDDMMQNFADEAKKLCISQGLYKDLEETIDDLVQLIIQKKSEYLKNR